MAQVAQPRVLVTGSRKFTSQFLINKGLMHIRSRFYSPIIVHGGAQGADMMMGRSALSRNMDVEVHPADWMSSGKSSGKSAGVFRNIRMVSLGAELCVAFFVEDEECRGTWDCVHRAENAGIEVVKYTQPADRLRLIRTTVNGEVSFRIEN